jgi:two-component system nitrate/nitrite response regulator NarL
MTTKSFAIAVIGQRALTRAGLAQMLTTAGYDIGAQATSVSELESLLISEKPLLLLIDIEGELPVQEIALARQRYPAGRIALLIEQQRLAPRTLMDALRIGAHACLHQPSLEILVKTLELVMLGGIVVPNNSMQEFFRDYATAQQPMPQPALLSPREQSIMEGLVEGHSNKAIARLMGITDATVKVHVKSILRKIGASNRTQAAIWATNRDYATGMLNGSPNPLVASLEHNGPMLPVSA